MKVYRISKCTYIRDLSGYGAYIHGGRWNSRGQYMIYTSQSIALSMLEVLVHFEPHLAPSGFCLLTLEIADDSIETLPSKDLPPDWNLYPGTKSTQITGDSFLRMNKKVALKVPSGIIEKESNLLLNPLHPLFRQKVEIISNENIQIDKRLWK